MERCPVCRARLSEPLSSCQRCHTDFSTVANIEHEAQFWLTIALQMLSKHEPQLAVQALQRSLLHKKIPLAFALRDFICQKECQRAMALLAQGKFLAAQKILNALLDLKPEDILVHELAKFTRYLLTKQRSF